MGDTNEEIWLTYEGILSEVENEYRAKFDVTEKVKQWAVARRMYQEGRQHVIQELIEKALGDAAEICQERYLPDERAKVLRYLSEWLKSQMEGE